MMGMLAGNKGFHCQADFYALQVAPRNSNRAQTGRQPGRDRTVRGHRSYEITRTFRRCVAHHATEFHNCCYAATVERIELGRVEQYRKGVAVSQT